MRKFDREMNQALRELILANVTQARALLDQEASKPGSVMERRSCPVCGGEAVARTMSNGVFTFDVCPECTLVYMNPVLREEVVTAGFSEQDPHASQYWALMQQRLKIQDAPTPPEVSRHPVLRDLVPRKPQGSLLDVGCSIGNFLAAAAHFYTVAGVEINPATAMVARQRGFEVLEGTLADMPGEGRFDVITLNQLLYGLKDPLRLIREAARLLKPGGILYINTPNADSWAMAVYGGAHCHLVGRVNLNVFSPRSLEVAAEKSGLAVETCYTEWLNLYSLDLVTFLLGRKAFVHRRNSFWPFYEQVCALDERIQGVLSGHRFARRGDYCVCLMKKPG